MSKLGECWVPVTNEAVVESLKSGRFGVYRSLVYMEPVGDLNCKKCGGTGEVKMWAIERYIKCLLQRVPLKFTRRYKPCKCQTYVEVGLNG